MDREAFARYLEKFNRADRSAFVDNLTEDVQMINGGMTLSGRAAVLEHYERHIWPWFEETVHAERIVADRHSLAVRMWTHFVARRDGETVFGPVRAGDQFDYRGVVLYEINAEGRFERIDVAYNSFTASPRDGATRALGMPH